MKTRIIFCIFFMVFVVTNGNAYEKVPVAVSPGSVMGVAVVGQSCPTFSWTAVPWATAYRVSVFKAAGTEGVTYYEDMEAMAEPVLRKEIPGSGLSWTPSLDERLSNGEAYVWYVQAVDAYGTGIWSEGRMFIVKEVEKLVGVEEKVRERLREYGVSEEVITDVFRDVKSEINEVVLRGMDKKGSGEYTPGIPVIQGYEGSTNTFYGIDAGANTTGDFNSFFGNEAGYKNTTGEYNTFIGIAAGHNNTTGRESTFIGYGAGYRNTTGRYNTFLGFGVGLFSTTGSSNTFIGYYAGIYNTKGSSNTFIGDRAGLYNTTGRYNTFLGYQVGSSNTTGSYNTFIGNSAGSNNTSGGYNTFIGDGAGYKNTKGKYNTSLGNNAGLNNTTGTNNTFLGYAAGSGNTTGRYNTFLGYKAGSGNTTGSYNTFLGNSAGLSNTTGGNNTFIGDRAGSSNKTGGNNTFLGYDAGYKNTRGKNNVFLGYKAGYNETGSNRLYIDSSNTSSPLIFGRFDTNIVAINGKLGVGKNPKKLIDVKGGAYCNGRTWVNASSREYKENIESLNADEAMDALGRLNPVKFNYKRNKEEEHVGFIAEDVPALVATKDRKGMSAMDVVAVLTKVVQEQQETLQEQQKAISELKEMIVELKAKKQDK